MEGASFASMATSSPIEVRTMTSVFLRQQQQSSFRHPLTSIFFLGAEELLDLITNFPFRLFDIILGFPIVGHEREEAIVGDIELDDILENLLIDSGSLPYKLIFFAGDVGDIHIVRGWAKIFKLLASEDVNGDEMDFGVTVLSGLGGTHLNDLTRARFDNHEAVFAERRALHRISGRGASIGALESVPMPGLEPSNRYGSGSVLMLYAEKLGQQTFSSRSKQIRAAV